MSLKRMGVLNVTPNSFSDAGEFYSSNSIENRIKFLSQFESIDIGAESTAPMNQSISWQVEWERWQMVLPHLKKIQTTISADTYHPETIFNLVKHWKDEKLRIPLIWNDVSGKYDESVRDFLKTGFDYVYCHNLAPSRELTTKHMDFVSDQIDLVEYFDPYKHERIIFDPCFGFSKNFDQNCSILKNFHSLQLAVGHHRWLIGFSRKSFLRKLYQTEDRETLDLAYVNELGKMTKDLTAETWIRTHRPELLLT